MGIDCDFKYRDGGNIMAEAQEIVIRPVMAEDITAIANIYSYYVLNTTATLEETPPTVNEMHARWRAITDKNMPFLVAAGNKGILGYAYAGPYRPRSGYRYSLEESVYVATEAQGQGVGVKLLASVIEQVRKQDYRQVLAVICGEANQASIRLHEKLGFVRSGVLTKVGFKFGQWIDTVLMQKSLSGL